MRRQSFWETRETMAFPALRGRMKTDVAVIGGGLSGLTAALWLSRAGLQVTVLEADRIAMGTTALCTGIVSPCGGLRYAAIEAALGMQGTTACAQTQKNAYQAVLALADESGLTVQETDTRILAERERLLVEEREALRRAGLPAGLEARHAYDAGAGYKLCVKGGFALHPLRYAQLLTHRLLENGAAVYEQTRVTALAQGEAYAEQGSVQASYLVIATGFPILNIPGWYFLRMRKQPCSLHPLSGEATFDGVYFACDGSLSLRPLARGALMARMGSAAGEERSRAMAEQFGLHMEQERYPGLECVTPDGLPYIGPYSAKTPNIFVAAGYGGRGILGAMTAAQAITARVLGLSTDGYEIYAGTRKSASMAGRIVGSYAMALLKQPSAPKCPHMGCPLRRNPATHLWECPCHGSQFDDIGHVLNGPAVRDAVRKRPEI